MPHKDKKHKVGLSSNQSAVSAFVSGFKKSLGGKSAAEAKAKEAKRKKRKAGTVKVARGRRLSR